MDRASLSLVPPAASELASRRGASKPPVAGQPAAVDARRSAAGRVAVSQVPKSLSQAVRNINEYFQIVRRDLHFSIHEPTGQTVVTVVDADTGEVVRQIPPEVVLAIAESIEEARGFLLEAEA